MSKLSEGNHFDTLTINLGRYINVFKKNYAVTCYIKSRQRDVAKKC